MGVIDSSRVLIDWLGYCIMDQTAAHVVCLDCEDVGVETIPQVLIDSTASHCGRIDNQVSLLL